MVTNPNNGRIAVSEPNTDTGESQETPAQPETDEQKSGQEPTPTEQQPSDQPNDQSPQPSVNVEGNVGSVTPPPAE